MSGGSYNYLCHAWDLEDLIAKQQDLQLMATDLAGLGYAEDAARETEELLLILRQTAVRVDVRIKRLQDVWKAVEWWQSSDYGEDEVHEALAKYRGQDDAKT